MGPTLGNVLYNDVLEIELESRAKSIAFANHLAMIVTARSKGDLAKTTNEDLKSNTKPSTLRRFRQDIGRLGHLQKV